MKQFANIMRDIKNIKQHNLQHVLIFKQRLLLEFLTLFLIVILLTSFT